MDLLTVSIRTSITVYVQKITSHHFSVIKPLNQEKTTLMS